MTRTLLEQSYGTYKLISWKASSSDGGSYYPLAEDASGFIMYNQDGYMSAQIMAGNREVFLKANSNSKSPSWHWLLSVFRLV